MQTVYLGTSEFGASVLRRLAASEHRPALVVTRPDRPRGRGRRLAPPPVAEVARELGIDLLQPESVNSAEARERIAAVRPEAVAMAAFGGLVKEPLLSAYPMLNVHPSLLPRWRGAAPIERAIEAGDDATGVSIMRPIEELDAGPVCLQRREPIRPDDDYGSLARRLSALGGELLIEALDGDPEFRDQPPEGTTYAEKIGRDDRRLEAARDPFSLARRVRALTPHVGAYVELPGGKRLGVRRARAVASGAQPPAAGEVAVLDGRLLYGCLEGALELLEVQPEGGRVMPAADYIRGHGAAPVVGA